LGGINANQTFMAIVAVVSAAALFWRHRPEKSARQEPVNEQAVE
jgi:hypothetical protein